MGILDKIFGGGKKKEESASAEALTVECPHAVLVPRWESVQDMGIESKASRYMCESCHEMFTPEQADALRESVSERMQASLEELQHESERAEAAKGESKETST